VPRRSVLHDYFQAGIIAVLFALFVRTYLVQAFQIPSPSMERTILVGDHILVNKFAYGSFLTGAERETLPLAPIKREDIIIFKYPGQPEKDYVKRVIGLPGETILIENRKVLIKFKPEDTEYWPYEEKYAVHTDPPDAPDPDRLNNRPAFRVPPNHYFVMGDNREDSRDSRDGWTVPRELIRGKALVVYWSVDPDRRPARPATGTFDALWQSVSGSWDRTRWDRTLHVIR
jgi:signal peptidase I